MNGRYKVPLGVAETAEDNVRVKRLIAAFPPGATYTIKVWNEPFTAHTTGDQTDWRTREHSRYAEIRARSGKPKSRRHKEIKASAAPPVPTVGQLEKRLANAEETLDNARLRLPENLRYQYGGRIEGANREWMTAEVERRARHKRIGRAVAVTLATHGVHAEHASHVKMLPEDYTRLDAACGRKVDRQSKVSDRHIEMAGSYLAWVVKSYADGRGLAHGKSEAWEPSERDSCIAVFLRVKGEVEYLAELVRLAKERV